MLAIVLAAAASAQITQSACAWAPDLSGGPLDVTFYVISDSEIGRGRPFSENVRYQRELVEFARSQTAWPAGFRSAGSPIAPPVGIVSTGDNIYGGPGGESPFLWLIQRLRFEWLWSRSRWIPPLDVLADPGVLEIEPIPYPMYPGLGNHDWDLGALQGGEATLLHHVREAMPGCSGVSNFHAPSGNYSWNWGRLHLVQLHEWAGASDPGGLGWLREDLRRVGTEAPVLLFQHYGFDGFSRQPNWWTDQDRSAFLDVACGYNVLGIVTGHTHHAYPADWTPVPCPAGKKLTSLPNFIGEDGILYNFEGQNGYFGDSPQGTGTFLVFRVVDDGTPDGSFMDVATVSWSRGAADGVEIRDARNGYDFVQTFPIATETPGSFRNLDIGGWQNLGGKLAGSPAPVDLGDRGTAVFAVHSDLRVRFRRESTNGALSDWMSFGSRRALAVTPLASKAGRLIVLLLSPTGAIEASFERLNGTFSPWRRIGSPIDVFVSAPQASVLRDGRIEAHAVGWGGVVYRTRTDGSAGWEPWQTLSGPVAGAGAALNPALVQTSAGRLAVLTRGSDGFAYLNRQLVEHGPWSGWSRVGRRAVSSDVAAVATGATLHAFARDTATGQVWSASGSIDDAEFSESVLDGPAVLLSAPAAVVSPNGELRLAVVGPWANLHWNRRRPPEPWAGWNAMPRKAVWFRPALLPLADARWGVYAVALSGGSLVRARELLGWTSFTGQP